MSLNRFLILFAGLAAASRDRCTAAASAMLFRVMNSAFNISLPGLLMLVKRTGLCVMGSFGTVSMSLSCTLHSFCFDVALQRKVYVKALLMT